MKRPPFTTQLAGMIFLAAAGFLVAHTVNGVILSALQRPIESPSTAVAASLPSIQVDAQTEADAVLQSGLFPLPSTSSFANAPNGADPGVVGQEPLNANQKLSLLGIVTGNSGGEFGVLEDKTTKRQGLYRLHAVVPDVGEVAAIEKDRVLLRSGTREEWVVLAALQNRGAVPVPVAYSASNERSTGPRRLDRAHLAQITADLPRLLTQLQTVPVLHNGKLHGYRLESVLPQGFFDSMGLRANDVLQRINGADIADPGMLVSILRQLPQERTVRIDVLRQSRPLTLLYEIQ